MTDAVVIALIVAVPPTLIGTSQLIIAMKNQTKLNAVHVDLNSRLTELIKASRAEGAQIERDKHTIIVAGVPDERNSGGT